VLTFYAFVGKLYTFLETVAGGIHLKCLWFRVQSASGGLSAYIQLRDSAGGDAMKALVGDEVIADSTNVIECKGYQYFPADSVHLDRLEKAEKTTDDRACPHGVQFYDVVVGDRRYRRAAWCYEAPRPEMSKVGGRYGFWQDVAVVDT
jgi:uncharacterized protein (DUF427 family)